MEPMARYVFREFNVHPRSSWSRAKKVTLFLRKCQSCGAHGLYPRHFKEFLVVDLVELFHSLRIEEGPEDWSQADKEQQSPKAMQFKDKAEGRDNCCPQGRVDEHRGFTFAFCSLQNALRLVPILRGHAQLLDLGAQRQFSATAAGCPCHHMVKGHRPWKTELHPGRHPTTVLWRKFDSTVHAFGARCSRTAARQ
eukprot:Skav203194  [mRNA]  locus=scaffold3430:53413:59574:- [translate_table: standard]